MKWAWLPALLLLVSMAGCGRERGAAAPRVVPLAVVATEPAQGTTAAVQQAVTATFNEPLACSTINAATFTLAGPGGALVTGSTSCSGASATFRPSPDLAAATTYTATLTTAVADTSGAALAANYVWSFTTGQPVPLVPPGVIFTTPANNATGVPVNQALAATFSEAMDPATVNGSTFVVTGPGGAGVAGTVTYVAAGSVATFTPAAALAGLTTYVATITTGASSLASSPLASNYAWAFTTGALPDTTKPTVVFSVPAQGATGVPTNQAVSATFSKAMNPATINGATVTVTGPGGAAVAGLVTYAAVANTATFTPSGNLLADTVYTATVTSGAQDLAGNGLGAGGVPNPWSFTTGAAPAAAPIVVGVSPSQGATGVPITQPPIFATFSQTMECASLAGAGFTVAGAGGAAVTGTVACTGATATFAPATTLAINTIYTVTIAAGVKDANGTALASPYVWDFQTGPAPPVPPSVISTTPANNATGVPVNQALAATFSEAMDPATVNGSTFVVTGPGGVGVAGTVTYVAAGSVATFTPAAALAGLTTYVATITTGASSLAGSPLASNYTWAFTTGALPDTTKPTVLFSVSAQGATGVPTNQAVSATFSKAMNPATINGATLTVTGPGGAAVAGLVTYAAVANTATFTPSGSLSADTVYTATVTSGAQDLAGNALGAGGVPNPWSFTTAAAADTTRPTILATSPADGSTNVAVNAAVSATFSKAMSPLTITTATFQLAGPGGAVVNGTVAYDAVTFVATFTPASILNSNTTYTATITSGAADLSGNLLQSGIAPDPWSFTTGPVPLVPPGVIFTTPANNATGVPVNQALAATFSEAMDPATVNGSTFVVTGPGGAGVAGTVTYVAAGSVATFTPAAALAGLTTYVATITTGASSLAGGPLTSNYAWAFTTGALPDTTKPTVVFSVPAQGATGVPTNQAVSATFSKAMNPATINGATVTVTGPGGAAVAGSVTYAAVANTATFTPSGSLSADTVYTATVTSGAQDLAGNALGAGGVPNPWSFTTAAAADTTRPTILAVSPADGSTNVAVNAAVSATFSKAMNPLTITTATFKLAGPGGAVVNGAVAYDAVTFVATFTPASILNSNTTYTATITSGAADLSGNLLQNGIAADPWSFTTAAAPTVMATNPANGATGVAIAQPPISATFSETMNCASLTPLSFAVQGAGGAAVAGTVACAGATATFTPAGNLASDTSYTATIAAGVTNLEGVPMASAFAWVFTTGFPPAVTSTSPVNGATGVAISQPSIAASFNQTMNCASLTTTSFLVATSAGAGVTGTVACSGATAVFTPVNDLAINTVYTATIAAGVTDANGTALASPYAWSFATGSGPLVAPTVISTIPANNATGVPVNQTLAATFSEAMDPATVNTATFVVRGPGGAAVAGTVTYVAAGSVATFTPAAALAGLTTYVATITTGATSLAGSPLASNYAWTFTTGLAPDTTKPTVLFSVPAQGATAVPTNQAVSATFSEAMNPATINGTTLTLTGPGGTAVAGLVTYAAVANTATFTPSANLSADTVYTATVTSGAQDLAGNALGAGGVPNPWSFTTAAGPNTTPPTIISTNPINGSTNVAVNAAVSATFSEAMNPLTITTATFQLTDPGGVVVNGTVAYDAVNFIATFTPASNLSADTVYTATVTTGAADLSGNALAAGIAPNPWNFTTAVAAVVPAVNLGTGASFAAFGGSAGITNQGTQTSVTGDIGTTGASTVITGFHDSTPGCTYTETPPSGNVGAVNGTIYTAPPIPTVNCANEGTAGTQAIANQAESDVQSAYSATSPAVMTPTVANQASELGGVTLPPGVYESVSGAFSIVNGNLTLDAQGNPNAAWVFQAASSLTVGSAPTGPRSVVLINGAQAKNVYWHVGNAVINGVGGGTMVGTILAQSGVTFSTAGNSVLTTLDGRALSLTASVTMVNTIINVP